MQRVLLTPTLTGIGKKKGRLKTQLTVLYELFNRDGYPVLGISTVENPILRILDIIRYFVFNNKRFDIVHIDVYSSKGFLLVELVSFLSKLYNKKIIMMLHGGKLPDLYNAQPERVRKQLLRADRVIAPSSFFVRWCESINIPVKEISNIIELKNYPVKIRDKGNPIFFWMRTFHPTWNPDMAIRVADYLKKKGIDFKLYMAGQDLFGLEKDTRLLSESLNLTDKVEFLGFMNMEQKVKYGMEADFYLHTNIADNTPISVLEACAMGMIVIASNVGGIPYLLEHGKNAMIVEENNHEQMAETIVELLNNPELCKKLSQNAVELAKRASWEDVKLTWLNLYDELMQPN